MPPSSSSSRFIPVLDLNPSSFAPYGEVIQNPNAYLQDKTNLHSVTANQGSATKWLDVSHLENHYHLASSRTPAKPVVNMFVCQPRTLELQDGKQVFPVRILERHPFTPQTFVPLGVCPNDSKARYLVIVAPTLPTTGSSTSSTQPSRSRTTPLNPRPYPVPDPPAPRRSLRERLLGARPSPYANDYALHPTGSSALSSGRAPQGPGAPDVTRLRAFIARGDQAVTYGPGTWHAPMVALGRQALGFVVVQFANGVGREDCQEVDVGAAVRGGQELAVVVGEGGGGGDGQDGGPAGSGIMRAKL